MHAKEFLATQHDIVLDVENTFLLAEGYTLVKSKDTELPYLCLKAGQSVEDRLRDRA